VPGAPARLTYTVTRAATGQPADDLRLSHEAIMHLIVVRDDLAHFQHLHPLPTGRPGELAVDLVAPAGGAYLLFAEVTDATGRPVLQRDRLLIGTAEAAVTLVDDLTPKQTEGLWVALWGGERLVAGQPARLTFRVNDPSRGAGVDTLRPYLGEVAHVVVLSADGRQFAHTHGVAGDVAPDHDHAADVAPHEHGTAATDRFGPEIVATHTFATPGHYKIWGQFMTADGRVATVAFVVQVR
jgi:Cu+-exporting ATPase